jgi:hypothetical protein
MAEPPIFGQADFNNLELVRQIVFHRLRTDANWYQFDRSWGNTERFVRFADNQIRSRFVVLANEILWQLIIQGIITPGSDASNPTLPWFRITDYGQEVLKHERFIPHDPTNYLDDLRAQAKTTLGNVTIAYVEEALRCFTAGCHMASVLLLGVAAESVFLGVCEVVRSHLKDVKDQKAFDKLQHIRQKHRWITDKYLSLPGDARRKQLPDSLDITLTTLYELIRRQRNDLGHPQENPPAVDRERAFVFFRTFPSYVRDVEAFAEYIKTNGL